MPDIERSSVEPTEAQLEAVERVIRTRRGLRQEWDEIANADDALEDMTDEEIDGLHRTPRQAEILREIVVGVLNAS